MTLESLGILSLAGAGESTLTGYEIADDHEWNGLQLTTISGIASSLTTGISCIFRTRKTS